jgi:hypothetical protein
VLMMLPIFIACPPLLIYSPKLTLGLGILFTTLGFDGTFQFFLLGYFY